MDSVQLAFIFSGIMGAMSAPAVMPPAECKSLTVDDIDNMDLCCAYPPTFSNQTIMTCEKRVRAGTTEDFECYTDCLFTLDKLLGPDNKFTKEAWTQHIGNLVNGEWFSMMADSPDYCQKFMSSFGYLRDEMCINSDTDMWWACMTMQWNLKCPMSSRNTSPECDKSRDKLQKCGAVLFTNS